MSGIGTAFIWAAIACGPVFMIVLGMMAARTAYIRAHLPARRRRER